MGTCRGIRRGHGAPGDRRPGRAGNQGLVLRRDAGLPQRPAVRGAERRGLFSVDRACARVHLVDGRRRAGAAPDPHAAPGRPRRKSHALRRARGQRPVAARRMDAHGGRRQGVLGHHRVCAPGGHRESERRSGGYRWRGQARPADGELHAGAGLGRARPVRDAVLSRAHLSRKRGPSTSPMPGAGAPTSRRAGPTAWAAWTSA